MKPKYILDKNGKVMPAEQFLKREAKGWFGTLKQALHECGDTGKEFFKECEQGASQFGRELTGTKKKKK